MVTPGSVSVVIEALGEDAIARELMRFGERLVDATPAFEEIQRMFYASEVEQFDSEGSWASGGWAPLAQSTLADKARHGFDPRILHRTLAMEQALTSSGADHSVSEIRADSMFVGTDLLYPIFHQKGTDRMPMRKPVELPEDVKVGMVKVLQRWLTVGVL